MSDALSEVFAALGDPTRRALYERLLEETDGRTATELVRYSSVSRQAIVKHLQVLMRSGLASAHRDGREVRYVARTTAADDASAWLRGRSDAWDRRVASLERRVRESDAGREN